VEKKKKEKTIVIFRSSLYYSSTLLNMNIPQLKTSLSFSVFAVVCFFPVIFEWHFDSIGDYNHLAHPPVNDPRVQKFVSFIITRSHPPGGKGRISKNPNTLRKNLTVEEYPTLPMTPPIVIQLVFRK
jgi:hypothetical protein